MNETLNFLTTSDNKPLSELRSEPYIITEGRTVSEVVILRDRLNQAVKLLKKFVHTNEYNPEEILDFLESIGDSDVP